MTCAQCGVGIEIATFMRITCAIQEHNMWQYM
jgi:hypothetical protein